MAQMTTRRCPHCKGTGGGKPNIYTNMVSRKCPECKGIGRQRMLVQYMMRTGRQRMAWVADN